MTGSRKHILSSVHKALASDAGALTPYPDYCGNDVVPTAFRHLTINAMPDPAAEGRVAGGEITAAWRRNDGFDYRLWTFTHPALHGERLIIAITPS